MLATQFLAASLAVFCGATAADISFPGSRPGASNNSHAQLPLDFALRFSNVENFPEFLRFLDEKSLHSDILAPSINNRLSEGEAEVPKNAACIPETQVVELVENKNTAMLYFPMCVRLQRCGGCCASELLKCQPTKTQTVNYTMYTTQYVGGDRVSVRGKQLVSVEKHLECRCSCAVKREDCHDLQEYDADSCSCRCLNAADEERCRAANDTKLWDSRKCMCFCRQVQNCSSGYFYDLNTCSCSETVEARRQRASVRSRSSSQGRDSGGRPLPVLPLNRAANRMP